MADHVPKTTPAIWQQAKTMHAHGCDFATIARAIGVDRSLVSRKAKRENWSGSQREALARVAELAREKAVIADDDIELDEAIETAAEAGANIIRTHQNEWREHRAVFNTETIKGDFERGKQAKISAEMLGIRQRHERQAWGLDLTDNRPLSELSNEELEKLARG